MLRHHCRCVDKQRRMQDLAVLHVAQASGNFRVAGVAHREGLHRTPGRDDAVEAVLVLHQHAALSGGEECAEGLLNGVRGLAPGHDLLHDGSNVGAVCSSLRHFQLRAQAAHAAHDIQSRADADPLPALALHHEVVAWPPAVVGGALHQGHQRRRLRHLDGRPDDQVGPEALGRRLPHQAPVLDLGVRRGALAEGPSDVALRQKAQRRVARVPDDGGCAAGGHEELGDARERVPRAADCGEMPVPRHQLPDLGPHRLVHRVHALGVGLGAQDDVQRGEHSHHLRCLGAHNDQVVQAALLHKCQCLGYLHVALNDTVHRAGAQVRDWAVGWDAVDEEAQHVARRDHAVDPAVVGDQHAVLPRHEHDLQDVPDGAARRAREDVVPPLHDAPDCRLFNCTRCFGLWGVLLPTVRQCMLG
mmetsp:Transcript_18699/g.56277  ORF Transcript_18699/g.56277 Transcript_18699/m.56277 type:complete len:416 (+) Transcript_18699:244-1491(+)